MDSSDDENEFNDEFFNNLRVHSIEVDKRKPQISAELPEVGQKYAIYELNSCSDNIPQTSNAEDKDQQYKEFLRDHKKECNKEIPCKIDLKQKVKFIVCDSYL
jgi:hypothetical protein